MPFTCAICALEIPSGSPMLSDDRMNVAHPTCVDRIPPVQAGPVQVCDRCRGSTPSTIACRRCYRGLCPACAGVGCCGSRPAEAGERTYCAVCGGPVRSWCPYCRVYLHSGYGFAGSCSLVHEDVCAEAREARKALQRPPPAPTLPPEPPVPENAPDRRLARPARLRKGRPGRKGRR